MTFITPKAPRISRAEVHLKQALEKEGVRFTQQKIIRCGNGRHYCVDFYISQKYVIIEVDGLSHDYPGQQRKDRTKTRNLENAGYKVLRFRNEEIWHNLQNVVKTIKEAATQKSSLIHQSEKSQRST